MNKPVRGFVAEDAIGHQAPIVVCLEKFMPTDYPITILPHSGDKVGEFTREMETFMRVMAIARQPEWATSTTEMVSKIAAAIAGLFEEERS